MSRKNTRQAGYKSIFLWINPSFELHIHHFLLITPRYSAIIMKVFHIYLSTESELYFSDILYIEENHKNIIHKIPKHLIYPHTY